MDPDERVAFRGYGLDRAVGRPAAAVRCLASRAPDGEAPFPFP